MRLFVAYRLADVPASRVAKIIAAIRGEVPRATWVAPHSLHLTFAFLGEQRCEVVPELIDALTRAVKPMEPVDAKLTGGGFFPNAGRARVGWIGVEPHAAVEAIATPIREALVSSGTAFDEKAFRAHLTLVRLREAWRPPDTDRFLRAVSAAGEIPFRLDRVSLFESRLLPSGAVHDELACLTLG